MFSAVPIKIELYTHSFLSHTHTHAQSSLIHMNRPPVCNNRCALYYWNHKDPCITESKDWSIKLCSPALFTNIKLARNFWLDDGWQMKSWQQVCWHLSLSLWCVLHCTLIYWLMTAPSNRPLRLNCRPQIYDISENWEGNPMRVNTMDGILHCDTELCLVLLDHIFQ